MRFYPWRDRVRALSHVGVGLCSSPWLSQNRGSIPVIILSVDLETNCVFCVCGVLLCPMGPAIMNLKLACLTPRVLCETTPTTDTWTDSISTVQLATCMPCSVLDPHTWLFQLDSNWVSVIWQWGASFDVLIQSFLVAMLYIGDSKFKIGFPAK